MDGKQKIKWLALDVNGLDEMSSSIKDICAAFNVPYALFYKPNKKTKNMIKRISGRRKFIMTPFTATDQLGNKYGMLFVDHNNNIIGKEIKRI